MTFTPYVIPYLLAAAMVIAFLPLLWKRRGVKGVGMLTLALAGAAYWCLGNAAELAVATLAMKRVAANAEYLASWLPAMWLVFCLQYTGRMRRLAPRWAVLVSVVPIITNALLWIPGHQLLRYDLRLEPMNPYLTVSYGPWFYFMALYNYVLMIAASGVLAVSLADAHRLFRAQGMLLMLASALPLAASVAYVLRVGPLPFLDLTPTMFAATVLFMAAGATRFRMFELVPAARAAVIETMPDALLVIDLGGRIVDANPAAARLLAGRNPPLVGQRAEALLPRASRHLFEHPMAGMPRTVVEMPDTGRLLELRLAPILEGGALSGWLALFHDVTERETLIRDLQAALADVHALSGLIPICAACKKVRDDEGYWQQVESYVSARSEAEFTHSICPDCAAKLYPEPSVQARPRRSRPEAPA
ncbi:MAG: histidine kinase N-terminal 7TM domain-containing protein [Anaerolineae bacterium]